MPLVMSLQTPHVGPGTVVSIPFIFGRHVGIVTDLIIGGRPTVISNSGTHGGVVEQPWEAFSAGNEVRIDGYPGKMPAFIVLARARARIGTSYRLLDWNCEHFIRYAHGLQQQSPQLAFAAFAALCVLWRVAA